MTESSETSRPATLEQWAATPSGGLTQLTVVFTDIIKSTALSNAMGDKRWVEMLTKHFDHCRSLMRQYKCYEIKTIGDSFMVAFHNAFDALNFAIAFLNNTGDEQIKIRAGIHAGAARIIGNDLSGGMVNYAARLIKWHKEEGIGLSDAAKEQIEDEIGRNEARHLFIRVSHKFKDYEQRKILWRVNCSDYWNRRIRQEFPSLEELRKDLGKMKFVIEPATADDIAWVGRIETEAYGEDAVPVHTIRRWHKHNPTGFFIVKTPEAKKVGHLDILPLRPEVLQLLLEGKIQERDLSEAALYAPSEREMIKDLYVESIIVLTDHPSRSAAIHVVLSEFDSLVSHICEPAKVESVYAIAATPEGDKFMRQLGFEQVRAGSERLDEHPFFAARYDDVAANINNILGR